MQKNRVQGKVWPTLLMLGMCYGMWGAATLWLTSFSVPLAILLAGVAIALHGSLQHEAIHGHPFRAAWLNDLAVYPALSLVIPYARFRDTHLAHHRDANLTDPHDDPESHYLDPARWVRLARPIQSVLRINNTLLGRVVLGPLVGTIGFLLNEARAHRAGDTRVLAGWAWHAPGVLAVVLWVWLAPTPVWAYLVAAYLGLGLLKIRTYLEHRAHEASRARTVIIEDRGPLALLFLNNNLHVVHHMHPDVPWYALPALYQANKARYLSVNEGYVYRSYWQIVVRYLFAAKDPVAHPLMQAAPGPAVHQAGRSAAEGTQQSPVPLVSPVQGQA